MCIISNKFTLCSCKTKDVSRLKNYWILYRYHKSEFEIIGEAIYDEMEKLITEDDIQNEENLLELLNSKNCFDADVNIKEKDYLELYFSCKKSVKISDRLMYCFLFKNKR